MSPHNLTLTPSFLSQTFSSSSPASTTSSEPFTPNPQHTNRPCPRFSGTWGPRPSSISDLLNTPTVSDADDDDDARSVSPFNNPLSSSADGSIPSQTPSAGESLPGAMTLVEFMGMSGVADAIAVAHGQGEVIDVDAEPASGTNVSGAKRVAEVVSLLSEDEEAERQRRRKRRRRGDAGVETVVLDGGEGEVVGGGEVEMVSHVIRGEKEGGRRAEMIAEEWAEGGGEVVCTGSRKGVRALRDYPHFRFQCEVVEQNGAMAFCERCFCYVCDVPAGECRNWGLHYRAVEIEGSWKMMRQRGLQARKR